MVPSIGIIDTGPATRYPGGQPLVLRSSLKYTSSDLKAPNSVAVASVALSKRSVYRHDSGKGEGPGLPRPLPSYYSASKGGGGAGLIHG